MTAERTAALDWAQVARARRAKVRDDLRDGSTDLASVLSERRSDEALGAVRLLWVLESVPGARKISTRRALDAMGVDHATPIGSIDDELAAVLLDRFGDPTAVDPGTEAAS